MLPLVVDHDGGESEAAGGHAILLLPDDGQLDILEIQVDGSDGADAPIDTLPGGEDPYIVQVGDSLPPTFVDDYGDTRGHSAASLEAELA